MQNPRFLWNLHNLGSAYGQRPASYLGLDLAGWEAYQVDLACLTVGRDVEERLRKKQPLPWQMGKRKGGSRAGRTFARLGGKARKMKMPESGIW